MAKFASYPEQRFQNTQRFLARDTGGSGQVVRVSGQSILDASVQELTKNNVYAQSFDTLSEAQTTDLASGVYVVTGGGSTLFDGDQQWYRVSDPGSGGAPMSNGNELVSLNIVTSDELGTAGFLDATTSDEDTTSNRVLRTENKWHTAQTGDYFTYDGSANAITLTSANTTPATSLITGQRVRFRATAANTGATTINVDGLGATDCVTVTGVALPADYIRTDVDTEAVYDGTNWVVSRKVESGSDANGEFTRWEDGTQECWLDDTGVITTAAPFTWTYPQAFSVIPYVNGSVVTRSSNTNYYQITFGTGGTDSRTTIDCDVYHTSPSGQDANATLLAKGKWY